MDVFVLSGLTRELDALRGAFVGKIFVPGERLVVIPLRLAGTGRRDLLISTESHAPGIVCLPVHMERPASPAPFAMALRKHLGGSHLIQAVQPGLDRMLVLRFQKGHQPHDTLELELHIELFGRHGNVVLVDSTGTIAAVQVPVGKSQSELRLLVPGEHYREPPALPGTVALPEATCEVLRALAAGAGRIDAEQLSAAVRGLGPHLASAAVAATDGTPEAVAGLLASWVNAAAAGELAPRLYGSARGGWTLSAVPFPGRSPAADSPPAFLEASLRLFWPRFEAARRGAERSSVQAEIRKELKRLERRIAAIGRDLERLREGTRCERLGELLKANMGRLRRGMTRLETVDFYDPEGRTVAVALDPALGPVENMNEYFRRAKKGRRGLAIAEERRAVATRRLEALRELTTRLDELPDGASVNALLGEYGELAAAALPSLAAGGDRSGKRSAAPAVLAGVRRFVGTAGQEILCGKNARGNDLLIRRYARPNDCWLHVRDRPGAHVVVRWEGAASAPDEVLAEAAQLAAFYSSARGERAVPVMATRAKHVHPVSRHHQGLVRVERDRTLTVSAEPEAIALWTQIQAQDEVDRRL
ncbi:MAG: NFACT family protein [Candidatus Schekmanbacteria bacterium]|nr:NFACT family protein [Candidatus Schekmanbacteria bacterium]